MKLYPIYGLFLAVFAAGCGQESNADDSAALSNNSIAASQTLTADADTDAAGDEATDTASAGTQAAEEQLRASIARLAPDMPITAIAESVMPGIYELVSGTQVFYLTPDGQYMLEGSIIDLEKRENISEQRRGTLQMSLINTIPEDQMVVFNNESGDAERSITVFTDTDCGYCQRLHQEIDTITSADIKVRYLLFPRAGIDSASSVELQSVWCADDPQAAMTIAKTGGQVPPAACENPIASHMDVAGQVGLRGTPLIYLDNGTKIPGYQPAAELIRQIESSEPLVAAK